MGREESARQRNASEILEALLQLVRSSEERQFRALEQLASIQQDFQREVLREMRAFVVEARQQAEAVREAAEHIVAMLPRQQESTPGTAPKVEARGGRVPELERMIDETRQKASLLDQALASSLRAIRERLDQLAHLTRGNTQAVERVALQFEAFLLKSSEPASRDEDTVASGQAARARSAEDEGRALRKELRAEIAALQQQFDEARAAEERRFRSLEHRLQDLEFFLDPESGARRLPKWRWLGGVALVSAALLFSVGLWVGRNTHPRSILLPQSAPTPAVSAGAPPVEAKANAATKRSDAWLERAEEARRLGDWPVAERAFRGAIEKFPNDPALRVRLAILLAEQQRFEAAREQAAEALRLDPDSSEIRRLLARIEAATAASRFAPTPSPKGAPRAKEEVRERPKSVRPEPEPEVRGEAWPDDEWGDFADSP